MEDVLRDVLDGDYDSEDDSRGYFDDSGDGGEGSGEQGGDGDGDSDSEGRDGQGSSSSAVTTGGCTPIATVSLHCTCI